MRLALLLALVATAAHAQVFSGTFSGTVSGGASGGGITSTESLGTCNGAADGDVVWLAPSNELRACDGSTWRKVLTDADGVLPTPDTAVPGQRFVAQAISGQTAFQALDGAYIRTGTCPNCYIRVVSSANYMPYLNAEQVSADAFTSYRFQAALNFVNAAHGITINGTTAIKAVVRVAVARDFASVPAGTCATESVTATGAATSDFIAAMADFALPSGLFVGGARVTAANTVDLTLCNVTSGALDAASGTFRFRMER